MGNSGKNSKKPSVDQADRFIDKARELGCDEDEKAFDDKLHRIGSAPPSKPKPEQNETPDK